MPTFRDFEMLNESMTRTGQTFRQARQDELEMQLRTRALDTADRRSDLEDRRQKAVEEKVDQGQVESWLTGDDGALVQYRGNPNGLQQLQEQAAARGKPLKLTKAPDRKANIGSFRTQTPLGELTFHLDSPDQVETVMGMAAKAGGTGKQPGEFNTRATRDTEYQAQLEAAVEAATTPEEAATAARRLAIFKENRGGPAETETITERFPAVEGQDAIPETPERGWGPFKKPAIPAKPAVPAVPERSVSRRVPVGTANVPQAAPMPTAPTAPAAPKVLRRADGKIRVRAANGTLGWANVDPNNLPAGYTLAQ